MDEKSLTFQYASHPPVRALIHTITDCVESVSAGFDEWETTQVQGPGLYVVVVAGTSIADYADPMGTNRWPVDECETVNQESFFESVRTVAFDHDGAVVVTVDGTIHEQMVRLKNLPQDERDGNDGNKTVSYADWMGARHMSALETSLREDVIATITLSEETGRVTRFEDGTYTTCHREELGGEWRGEH